MCVELTFKIQNMKNYRSIPSVNQVKIELHKARQKKSKEAFQDDLALKSILAMNNASKRKKKERLKIALVLLVTSMLIFFIL